jgi:hypothetical protein
MGTGTSAAPGQESGDGAQEKAQEVLGQAQEKGQACSNPSQEQAA